MSEISVQVTLTVIDGPDRGLSALLQKPRTILGRKNADFALTDSKVSIQHAAIEISGTDVHVVDLNSRNGVFLKGEKVTDTKLQNLDEFEIGLSKLKIFILEDLSAFKKINTESSGVTPTERRLDIDHLIDDELKRFSKWDLSQSSDEVVQGGDLAAAGYLYGLEVLQGPDQGRTIRIGQKESFVGRGNTEIVLHDPDVSRLHCSIEVTSDGKVTLKDLGSTNGTYVNSKRISEVQLRPDDQIQVGGTLLRFVASDS
jgi:pSer/pThr/pTyr-binding forkhead associated (FHA) protein